MENKNLNDSLFYGNIVKIVSSGELSNDTLFFVDYIDSFKIKLITDEMKDQIFHLNPDGGIDNIEKITIIHQQEEGYCVINRLFPGKLVKINFSHEDAFIQGEIKKLENDMILVNTEENEKLYIDFEYSGLLEKYNIRSIDIIKHYENYQIGEYDQVDDNNFETDTTTLEEGGGTMYTIEQQVNDYIEKNLTTAANKNKLVIEIDKYKLLLEEYTSLDSGIRIKKIPNNQLLYSIFNLNPKVVNLASSYLHKELYYNNEKVGNYEFDSVDTEVSKWQYSVIEKNYNSSPQTFSDESYESNVIAINHKINDNHKKMRMESRQDIAIINKVSRSNNTPFFFAIGKDGEINVVPYDIVRVDKGEKIILNGILFKKKSALHKEMNVCQSSDVLSKTLQSLEIGYEKMTKIKLLTNDAKKSKNYFDDKKFTFHEFQKGKAFKEYIEDLDFGLKEVYEQIFDRKEVSIHQCLKKLSLFNISKLNLSEYLFIQKLIRENLNVTKRMINEQRTKFIRMSKKTDDYVYLPHENVYEIVRNAYLSKEITNSSKSGNVDYQTGELLKIASIDNLELLLFELRQLNKENHINFDDDEVNDYILDLEAKLNGEISKKNHENKVDYSKYYGKKGEMLQDVNKIILKNVNKTDNNEIEKYDPIQYLYENIIANTKFNGTVSDFVKDIELLLRAMHEENENFAEFDNIFETEKDQKAILETLIKIIQNKQIRKDHKCYVEDEKKFYIYDGDNWISAEDSNMSLSKKKLLRVQNSIDVFEDIKTKIINDSVIKYAHKNEMRVDHEKFSSLITRNKLNKKIKSLKQNKLRQLLKYNAQKVVYEKMFDNLNFDELQYYSPYTDLLYIILGIDDLNRKYTLIQRFVSLFTIDNGDEKWLFCIKKNTKLMPKYLQKLSESYLLYNKHESVMKEICLKEGYLSENGDSWIHKESGFTIKQLDFDTNYGYDENGFKIKLDTIEDIDNLENNDEQDMVPSTKVKQHRKVDKNVFSLLKELTTIIMNDLHIKFKNRDNDNLIYLAMEELFQESHNHPKYKSLNLVGNIYIVLSMILIYVQCKSIVIDKPYSSCNLSFSGFPYEDGESSFDGIKYLACYFHTRVNPKEESKKGGKQKISQLPKLLFKQFVAMTKSEEDIKNDLIDYIKIFMLKNDFVKQMISKKKAFEIKHPNTYYISEPPTRFKPSLIKITTQDDDIEGIRHHTTNFSDKYEKKKRENEMINMKIEEEIKLSVKKENPLIKTHYEEPFLVNFCCQHKELTLNSLLKNDANKSKLSKLIKRSNDLFESISSDTSKYLKGTSLNIPILNNNKEDIVETRIYNEETIYSFLSEILNLEIEDKNIPDHLKEIAKENNIEELGDDFYEEIKEVGKKSDIQNKMKVAEKYGVEFSRSFMEKVITQHHRHRYEEEEKYKQKEAIKNDKMQNAKTKVLSDFQFEYIENIGPENVIDKFETESKVMFSNYSKFIMTHLNKPNHRVFRNNIKTLMNEFNNGTYLETQNSEQFELYIKQLYNINYHLIALIPGLLINKQFHNDVNLKQFNFAETHINDLIKHSQSYRNGFDKITNASEETIEIIKSIANHKDILYMKLFNKKRTEQYSFLLYIFYKVLNLYIELNESIDVLIGVNSEIVKMILEYMKNTAYSYEKMVTNHRQSKQSEKSVKTEALRKMKPQEREAEKYKMSAKLGEWSYGNQSRVFKYYKQFYDEDTDKANDVKNIAQDLYAETITDGSNEPYDDSQFENSLTSIICDEETQNITLVGDADGIVLDDNGCELDDYE
jgi:hypothetical protein